MSPSPKPSASCLIPFEPRKVNGSARKFSQTMGKLTLQRNGRKTAKGGACRRRAE